MPNQMPRITASVQRESRRSRGRGCREVAAFLFAGTFRWTPVIHATDGRLPAGHAEVSMIVTIICFLAAVSRGHASITRSRNSSDRSWGFPPVVAFVVACARYLQQRPVFSDDFEPHLRPVDPVVAGSSPVALAWDNLVSPMISPDRVRAYFVMRRSRPIAPGMTRKQKRPGLMTRPLLLLGCNQFPVRTDAA